MRKSINIFEENKRFLSEEFSSILNLTENENENDQEINKENSHRNFLNFLREYIPKDIEKKKNFIKRIKFFFHKNFNFLQENLNAIQILDFNQQNIFVKNENLGKKLTLMKNENINLQKKCSNLEMKSGVKDFELSPSNLSNFNSNVNVNGNGNGNVSNRNFNLKEGKICENFVS